MYIGMRVCSRLLSQFQSLASIKNGSLSICANKMIKRNNRGPKFGQTGLLASVDSGLTYRW